MLTAQYDFVLVAVSLLAAILASYTALDMAGRVSTTDDANVRWWLAGGAVAMGVGIWSMHFIGMLAFRLPVRLGYDAWLTFLSLAIAIAASGFALWRVSQAEMTQRQLLLGALLMGLGIAAMHYSGMAAMRMWPSIQYDPWLFALSILIAIAASGAALWIAFTLRMNTPHVMLARAAAAVAMGVAIVGMHYTGMAAANFPLGSVCLAAREGISPGWLAIVVVVVTLAVLAIALLTSVLDARLESHTARLARSLEVANKALTRQTLHDQLTDLPNRTLLKDRLDQAIRKAQRDRGHFGLLFIDLDGFKAVNDTLGHHVGDLLLAAAGQRLRAALRLEDTVARMGGDEFIVLLELKEPEDAAPIADELVHEINRPFTIEQHQLTLSASMGIAIYPEDGDNAHDLLIHADAAMYHTKNAGRNGYHFFEVSMNAHAHRHLRALQDMRSGMDKQEFRLFYQAKQNAVDGTVTGAEALLRWQHPERGLLAPPDFLALAEKSGMIVPLGEWVLDEACRQMQQWRQQSGQDWSVAVNLSAVQFASERLLQTVQAALDKHALPARCLTLEVTESTAMHDVELSREILHSLAALGVGISIDDFGTGYSSLLYLKRLPASELKIDRGFVAHLPHDAEDAAIVTAIVALGHTLNLRVVAEGVETPEQRAFLQSLGCDILQGYLIGRPCASEEFFDEASALTSRAAAR